LHDRADDGPTHIEDPILAKRALRALEMFDGPVDLLCQISRITDLTYPVCAAAFQVHHL
jgi:hypothetical protein